MDSVSRMDVGQRRGRTTGCFGRSHQSHRCPCVQPGGLPGHGPGSAAVRPPSGMGGGGAGSPSTEPPGLPPATTQAFRSSGLRSGPPSRLGSPQPGSLCPPSFQAALCYRLGVSQPAPTPTAAPGPGGAAQTQPPTVRLPWTNGTAGPRLPVSSSAGSPAHLTLQP